MIVIRSLIIHTKTASLAVEALSIIIIIIMGVNKKKKINKKSVNEKYNMSLVLLINFFLN